MFLVGKKIQDARKRLGISQEELASKLGVKQTFITHIEKGARLPSAKNIFKIEKILGINLRTEYFEEKFTEDEKEIARTSSTIGLSPPPVTSKNKKF